MTIMIVLLCHLMVMLMDGLSSNPLMDRIQSFSKSLITVVLRIVYHYKKPTEMFKINSSVISNTGFTSASIEE